MSIIRIIHNKENPYVQLNKKALWDEKLSLKAVGLWARCMSRPDNWEFYVSELVKKSIEGKAAIYGAIDELIKHGYCIRRQAKEGPNLSRWGRVEYVFYEFPIVQEDIDKLKEILPHSTFQHAEIQHAENRTLPKKEPTKERKEKTPPSPKSEPPQDKKYWRGFFSKMKDEEFEMGWREYEAQPKGSVKSLKAWLPAVVKRLNLVVDQKIEISKMIAKRSETAHRWDGLKNSGGDMVTALRDRVEFTDGPHYKAVRYDVSQEEWSKQTGWN